MAARLPPLRLDRWTGRPSSPVAKRESRGDREWVMDDLKHEHNELYRVHRNGGDLVRRQTGWISLPDRPGSVAISSALQRTGSHSGAAAARDVRSARAGR